MGVKEGASGESASVVKEAMGQVVRAGRKGAPGGPGLA